ncbi:gamma-butyrobetaine hydroxylase-like domain-containing protein [Endozoicomonadaceae bacterium StTr2]
MTCIPEKVHLHRQSGVLELTFEGLNYQLSAEFLRVLSPSAEVRGHGNPVLQHGKKNVGIQALEPAGNYALKIIFDDGHDSGLYDWSYLYELSLNQEALWQDYLQQLSAAGKSRDPDESVVRLI